MKRLCYKCFSELPENANYCPNCGEAMREQETKTKEIRIGSNVRTKTIPLEVVDKAICAEDGTNNYDTEWNTKVENQKIQEETLRSLNMYPLALVGPFSTIQKEKGKNLWEGRSKIYEEITSHEIFMRTVIKEEAKERFLKVCIDPDSRIAEEIMYQTTILKEILDKLYVFQNTGSAMINTQKFARAVRGVCNEEKEKEGELDEL